MSKLFMNVISDTTVELLTSGESRTTSVDTANLSDISVANLFHLYLIACSIRFNKFDILSDLFLK